MYYVVSSDSGKILETYEIMSEDVIKRAARDFDCAVYAIRGEHSGYTAERPNTRLESDAADGAAQPR